MTLRPSSPVFFFLLLTLNICLAQEPDVPEKKGKVVRAVRVNSPPRIDGRVDDKAWSRAQPISDFTQEEPENGEAPTESTKVWVVYDDQALYVAVRAYDSEPNKIVGRLTRRDQWSESDWIFIAIDSRHDHQTGFAFGVNPAGVKIDAYLYNDTREDESWDAVWDAETSIDSLGWCVEFKIPYSMLRFPPAERYTWGFNVSRRISRKKEEDVWVYKPRKASGGVSRFGHLVGIEGIKPHRRLEILPYVVSRSTFEPKNPLINPDGREFFQGLGADIKYGFGPGITLDLTINPDFGQVEADPSVLNLTVFETFFEEKRPFFIEGAKLFETPFTLFHSRRIGKRPGRFGVCSGDEVLKWPDCTTILGAAKLTGKTSGGTSFGVLDAVTAREYATVDSVVYDETTGMEKRFRRKRLIEPLTNYFVGRLQQDLLQGNSTIGAIFTAVNRQNSESAYTGGVDWNLRFFHNTYSLSGQIAGSRAGPWDDRKNGYGIQFKLTKQAGKWIRGRLRFEAESPHFRINDLGYLRRNDWIGTGCWLQFRTQDPRWITRRTFHNFNTWVGWNFDRVNLSKGFNYNNSIQFLNYWWAGWGFSHNFKTYDDLDTRGGPLIVDPPSTGAWLWFKSDSRKALQINPVIFFGRSEGGSHWWGVQLRVKIKPSPSLSLTFSPRYNRSFDAAQWVTNIDEDGDGTLDHFVYGELRSQVWDLTMRADMTFTRDLSFQFYMQPFIAVGRYSNFKELARPASFEFRPYQIDLNPDFNSKSLKSNAVLRWEYRPGSTLYVVWSQSRSDFSHPGDFSFGRDFGKLFTAQGQNIFLIKTSYWFNL